MSFYEIIKKYENFDFDSYFKNVTDTDVLHSIENAAEHKAKIKDLLNLISDKADNHLEEMARVSRQLTHQHFGKAITLYRPIYVANYCCNSCVYCGFSALNKIKRKQLTLEEVEQEAKEIAKTEVQQILLLTGESEKYSDFNYICECVKVLKKYFDSISIEVYPLSFDQYKTLKELGVDGLTIYQETYDEKIYDELHLKGPKKNYLYRLDTPERGAAAGIRVVSVGALFGLANPLKDAFFSALHAKYLLDNYKDVEATLSIPRIKKAPETFKIEQEISDAMFVKFLLAFRLFLPTVGLNVSTRETATMRDHIIDLGITKMSGGSKTDVGGYSMTEEQASDEQFTISDERSLAEVASSILSHDHQPIYKDWWQLV